MAKKPTLLTVVALALIDETGRVLVQQRPPQRSHGGLWEFPGGKVEPGEGPCAALVREIDEELGIMIACEDLFPVAFSVREAAGSDSVEAGPLVLLLYGCRRWQGTPTCEPGAALAWSVPESLAAFAMPPLDVPLAAALLHLQQSDVKGLAKPPTRS